MPRRLLWSLVGLAALTAWLYRAVAGYGWVYEDAQWRALITGSLVPTRNLTLWTFNLGGGPGVAHLVNLGLHLGAGALVGLLVYRMTRMVTVTPTAARSAGLGAVSAAGLFWLHPMQTEAVAYISGRPDVLSAVFVLVAVLSTSWALRARSIREQGVAALVTLGCLTLAVLAKPSAVCGVLLVGWLMVRDGRMRWPLALSGLAALGVLPLLASWGWLGWAEMSRFAGVQAALVVHYAGLTLLPIGQSIDHDVSGLTPLLGYGAVLLVGVAMAWAWTARRTAAGFGVGWVILAVAPRLVIASLYLPHGPEYLTEHHWYLPMAGLAIALGSKGAAWLNS